MLTALDLLLLFPVIVVAIVVGLAIFQALGGVAALRGPRGERGFPGPPGPRGMMGPPADPS